jgi:hypothetical protein
MTRNTFLEVFTSNPRSPSTESAQPVQSVAKEAMTESETKGSGETT